MKHSVEERFRGTETVLKVIRLGLRPLLALDKNLATRRASQRGTRRLLPDCLTGVTWREKPEKKEFRDHEVARCYSNLVDYWNSA